MNNFHEQAMGFVYQQVLHRLLGFFSRPERIALQLLIQRLLVAAVVKPTLSKKCKSEWKSTLIILTTGHYGSTSKF